jgi:RHH-type proline utilization regulon transcriptional repressor/proline dehydrogenase/delta 1-pyrroline-5-carboxylate dehydrogenase
MTTPDRESRTQQVGRDLFGAARRAEKTSPSDGLLDRVLMKWGMRDEQLKAQLFRFIDVLPALTTPAQVNGHLREYLGTVRDRLPTGAGAVLKMLPDDGFLGRRVAELARSNTRRMARRFIAATDLPEAIAAIQRLRARSLAFTIDLLGEAVLSAAEAERYQGEYLHLVEGLTSSAKQWPANDLLDRDAVTGKELPRVNVSVKLSSLFSQFDPIDPAGTSAAVRNRLRPILRLARKTGAFVNIDMESYAYKDVTLRIFKEVFDEDEFRDWPDVGIAIQAYLRDCGDDLRGLADWAEKRGTPVWVRLVKGAYWDYETVIAAQNDWPVPVFSEKPETDANFEAQTTFLIEHHEVLRPAIASHNIRSIAHALALAEARGLPPRGYEFQMLYGMADPIKAALVEMGHRVRVYTPYGQLLPGMAYLVRRLLENTSNESFLRAGFLENLPEEQLLMNPMELLRRKRQTSGAGANGNGHPAGRPASAGRNSTAFRNEPLTDFSREEARESMRRALDEVRPLLGRSFPLGIAGRPLDTGKTVDSINPSRRDQVVGRVAAARVEDVNAAVGAAKSAFPAWRDTPAEHRAELLFKSADILRRRRFELAAWEVFETAKPWREADADVAEAIDYCDYYAREMLRLEAPHRRDVPGESNATFYEPRGVAVTIAPWNFPLAILCGMTAAALVTGNIAIMKPAEQSAVVAAKLMDVFEEAGFPPGVVNYLPGVGEEIGPALVSHPDVSMIAFTGSRAVGLAIQKQAAEVHERQGQDHIKRVITELGGKNAIIIDDDADLDEAVHGVVASAFGYAGQKCSACSRVIALAGVYDAFLARLVEATRSLKVGPADDPAYSVGPVIDDDAGRRVSETIERGKSEGRLAYAADVSSLAEEGCYVGPTIFADVPPGAKIAQEEIFGPVLAVIRAKDLSDAIAIANGTKYALTGGLFSRSPANIERVRREFRVGNLYVNRKTTGALVDRQPFGGFKLSGTGPKAGGRDYLPQFMVARTITENTLRRGFAPSGVAETAGAAAGE